MGGGVYRELFASRAIAPRRRCACTRRSARTKTCFALSGAPPAGERRQFVIRASACQTMRYLLRSLLASPLHSH